MSTARVHGIAAGGDGVARLETGMTVFIPRTAVGDIVDVDLIEMRKRFARGIATRILEPAPERVAPVCPHYEGDACGGCQLQHVAPGAQRAAKARIVGDALRRLARREVTDPDITPAPSEWRYRRAVTLHVVDDRIGYHRFDQPGRVFDLIDCHIARASLMALWPLVSAARTLLPTGAATVALREDRGGGLHVAVGGGTAWDARPFATALPQGVSVWWAPEGGAPRVVAGPATGYPALAFAQSHPELAQQIRVAAVEGLALRTGSTIWDLYGGVGDTARLMAAAGATVVSVDADRAAIEWARKQPGTGITYVGDRVEEAVSRLPSPDHIVLNPPRAGAHARVTAALERWAQGNAGGRVAYISCDPATLSRDLARLPTLRLLSVRAFDQFPQTAHVETLTLLEAA
ncbi:MAG: TRAM domain-containing protein [Gemmatimonadales bacterium]